MKTIRFAIALAALSLATDAAAMPPQVSPRWYDNMMFRLDVMAGNGGFCRAFPEVWVCQGAF